MDNRISSISTWHEWNKRGWFVVQSGANPYLCPYEERGRILASLAKETGVYCLDISKQVFGGVVLAGVMDLGIDRYWLFGWGFVIVLAMAVAGLIFIGLSNLNNK